MVIFAPGPYWDMHYRGRPWYGSRSQWDAWGTPSFRPPPPPPRSLALARQAREVQVKPDQVPLAVRQALSAVEGASGGSSFAALSPAPATS